MGHVGTEPECLDAVALLVEEIGMAPVQLKKERRGYILSSLFVPFLTAAAKLYVRGVADFADFDATWRRATGAPIGPFEIYDFVGMQTPYHLNAHNPDEEMQEFAKILKQGFIDRGRLGRGSGKGFYEYD